MSDSDGKMSRSKIEAFYREFPWLETVVPMSPDLWITVERIDLELFKRNVKSITSEGILGYEEIPNEKLFALDSKGNLLGQVGVKLDVKLPSIWKMLLRNEDSRIVKGERSAERMFQRLGVYASRVSFILSVQGSAVKIFKSPRNMTIQEYIEMEIRKAQEVVRAEIAAIDSSDPICEPV